MNAYVKPPRGSVKLTRLTEPTQGGHAQWRVDCTACGWGRPDPGLSCNRAAAEEAKRCHRCLVRS